MRSIYSLLKSYVNDHPGSERKDDASSERERKNLIRLVDNAIDRRSIMTFKIFANHSPSQNEDTTSSITVGVKIL